MSFTRPHWTVFGFAIFCVAAGCHLLPKSKASCGNCVPSGVAEVPVTYENYTPPQAVPVPAPVELPPQPNDNLPPSPSSRAIPDGQFDFFDSQNTGLLPKQSR